jgi:DNA-binding response OmpR family regulator
MKTCPTCGQELPDVRLGVAMTPLKVRMFDLIKRAGNECISAMAISVVMFDGKANYNTIKAHIHQINEMIEGTGWRIEGLRGYGYYLKQRTENGK